MRQVRRLMTMLFFLLLRDALLKVSIYNEYHVYISISIYIRLSIWMSFSQYIHLRM